MITFSMLPTILAVMLATSMRRASLTAGSAVSGFAMFQGYRQNEVLERGRFQAMGLRAVRVRKKCRMSNIECRISNVELPHAHFDIRHSIFDIRHFLVTALRLLLPRAGLQLNSRIAL